MAALLLAVAAGLTVRAVTAEPAPGTSVVVAARDLPAGHVLRAADLDSTRLPAEAVPDGLLSADEVSGRALAAPARRGETLTDARLAGTGQLVAAPPDTVAVPVPVSDPSTLAVVRAGDAVRVLGGPIAPDGVDTASGEPARVLVDRAVVLAAPDAPTAGLLDSGAGSGFVLLAMTTSDALRVADAPGRRWLGIAILP